MISTAASFYKTSRTLRGRMVKGGFAGLRMMEICRQKSSQACN
jgi:hypothetical protein